MNMNQIINMIIRILLRKGINAGINQGMRAMRGRGGQRPTPPPQQSDQPMSAQERAEFEEFKRQKKLGRSSVPQTKRKSNQTIERM